MSAEKVLQSEILPELKPFKNQRLRCAEVPWVSPDVPLQPSRAEAFPVWFLSPFQMAEQSA